MRRLIAIGVLIASIACTVRSESDTLRSESAENAKGSYRTTRSGALSDSVLHLANGDSVELQSTDSVQVPNEPGGLMVTYYPYRDPADTVLMQQKALAVFDALRPRFARDNPPWIVLRAASRPAAQRNNGGQDAFFGVVLEKHADGHWYPLHGASPVR